MNLVNVILYKSMIYLLDPVIASVGDRSLAIKIFHLWTSGFPTQPGFPDFTLDKMIRDLPDPARKYHPYNRGVPRPRIFLVIRNPD